MAPPNRLKPQRQACVYLGQNVPGNYVLIPINPLSDTIGIDLILFLAKRSSAQEFNHWEILTATLLRYQIFIYILVS